MKERLGTIGLPILITLAGFMIAYQFVDPAPPAGFTIATGQSDGSYYRLGNQYKTFLEQHNISLHVTTSAGSVENLQRLKDGTADVAFVQSGIMKKETSDDLLFLGSLYYEPLWVFHRSNLKIRHLSELRGKRIAVGPEGSGTRAIALQLLADNGIGAEQLSPLSGEQAVEALADNQIDALFAVTSANSILVDHLLHSHGITLMNFERAKGYTRKHPFLSAISLPEGAIDMAANIPSKDVQLLAPAATLIAKNDLHPALQVLLLQAAAQAHSHHGLFEKPKEFPSPLYGDTSISEDAARYYESGTPFLQRFLPFWAATLIDRLKVMLLPLIALLLPLIKVMPPIYRWRIRSRIYNHYRDLAAIDEQLQLVTSKEKLAACVERLNLIEKEIRGIHVPLAYREELYELRTHLALVRSQAEKSI